MPEQNCLGSVVHCGECVICQQVAEYKLDMSGQGLGSITFWERKTMPRTSDQMSMLFPERAWEFEGGPR